jgi:sporulation protein YabP
MNESRPIAVQTAQDITVKSRSKMSMTGVTEIVSFDEQQVTLRTVCGELCIEGEGLHIGVLDTERGVVTLEAKSVDGIYYPQAEVGERRGLFGRWRK